MSVLLKRKGKKIASPENLKMWYQTEEKLPYKSLGTTINNWIQHKHTYIIYIEHIRIE